MNIYSNDRTEILGRIDLAHLAGDLGLASGGRGWHCPNPNHAQTGATPPMSIRAHGPDGYGVWHCHGCNAGGTAIDMLSVGRGLSTADAFAVLRKLAGLPEYTPAPPPPPIQLVPAHDPESDRIADPGGLVAAYIESRNWDREVAARYDLHLVRGRWGHPRVRHPYRSGGQVIWWQDRAIHPDDKGPKWHSPAGMTRQPFAHDLTPVPGGWDGPLWLCEGPADVITLAHVLPDDAGIVGLPGTSGVERWAELWEGRQVIICFDADNAGDGAADAIHGWTDRLRPPEGHDLTSWRAQYPSYAAWLDVLDKALPVAAAREVTR